MPRLSFPRAALAALAILAATGLYTPPVAAQQQACRAGVSFERYIADFRKEALAKGISPAVLASAAPFFTYSQAIVNRDRGQHVFSQTFLEFSARMAAAHRIQSGKAMLTRHANAFARAERDYGVPGPVIAAFWGLESDFGANVGKTPILPALATLAYDCRRSEMFRNELLAALLILERGDLTIGQLVGSWAGELGQTQFLPAHYYKYGVDYDGDGRRDLIHSAADVIGSTAHYLAGLGWKRGEPWLQEVRVPASLPWDQADLTITHPRSQWAAWGVTFAGGRPLPGDGLRASLLLPMGRNGPAFLAYDNFKTYREWNNSLVYSTTAAYLATRIAGAGPVSHGNAPVPAVSYADIRDMQQMLARRGYDVGKIDGILGVQSRAAVKAMQIKFGLPADSYPTPDFIARLRAAR